MDVETIKLPANYFINASAGTGKTYSINKIVYRLLSENNSDFDLDNILIVTYTEKAVEEIKHRIRENIYETYEQAKKCNLSKNIVEPTKINFDNAHIYTIHSFCQKTLENYFFSASSYKTKKLMDDQIQKEFILNYMNSDKFMENFKNIFYVNPDAAKFNTCFKDIENILKSYFVDGEGKEESSIISLDRSIMTIKEIIKILYVDDLDTYITELKKIYGPSLSNDPTFIKLLELLPRKKSKPYNYNSLAIKEKENIVKYICNHLVFSIFPDIMNAFNEYKEKNSLITFNDMINLVRDKIKEDNSLLKKTLNDKYKLAIIDEFQDTNEIQWNIFSDLFLTEGHNLICVGDGKQSIYSFQGADVSVFLKAKKFFIDSKFNIEQLEYNFRSSTNLVNNMNNIFLNVNVDKLDTDKEPCFRDSESKSKDEIKNNVKAFYKGKEETTLSFVCNNDSYISVYDYAKLCASKIIDYCSKNPDNETETNLVFKYIEKNEQNIFEQKQRNATFSDFAILAKKRAEQDAFVREFKKLGIPFLKYKDNSLYNGTEAKHWLAMLNAINAKDFTGSNRTLFRKALASDFFGLTPYQLSNNIYDKDDTDEMRLFQKWKKTAKFKKWETLFESMVVDSNLQQNLEKEMKPDSLTKFLQIQEVCIDFMYEYESLESLIRKLRNAILKYDSMDDDGGIVQIGTSKEAVNLLTIHASKGLEYPVVFSIGEYKNYAFKEQRIFIDRQNKKLTYERPKQQEALEQIRLTYVNYTRAKYLLFIPYMKPENLKYYNDIIEYYKENKPSGYDYRFIDFSIFKVDDITDKDKIDAVDKILKKASPKKDELDNIKKSVINQCRIVQNEAKSQKTNKNSYSSLSHPKNTSFDKFYDPSDEPDEQDDLTIYDEKSKAFDICYNDSICPENYDLPCKGKQIGLAIHEIFELFDYTLPIDSETLENIIVKSLRKYVYKVEDKDIEIIKKLVNNVLCSNYPAIKGNGLTGEAFKLNTISSDDKLAELSFDCIVQELKTNYLNGSIDLVFKHDSVYSIIDWKTDSLNTESFTSYSNFESLKNHCDEKYSIQRVLYCYTLIRWLAQSLGKNEEDVFNEDFGGIYYVFVRGCNSDTSNGIYVQTWDSYTDLKDDYEKIIHDRMEA